MITARQCGDSPQFQVVLGRIRVPGLGPGRPRTRPDRVRADRAYGSRANRAYLRKRVSAARFRRSATRSPTARSAVTMVGGRRSSTRPTTKSATRWSAESIASSGTAQSPRDTTNSPPATRRPYWSQSSTSGCDQHFRNAPSCTGGPRNLRLAHIALTSSAGVPGGHSR